MFQFANAVLTIPSRKSGVSSDGKRIDADVVHLVSPTHSVVLVAERERMPPGGNTHFHGTPAGIRRVLRGDGVLPDAGFIAVDGENRAMEVLPEIEPHRAGALDSGPHPRLAESPVVVAFDR